MFRRKENFTIYLEVVETDLLNWKQIDPYKWNTNQFADLNFCFAATDMCLLKVIINFEIQMCACK
jgi:hypothetical protein